MKIDSRPTQWIGAALILGGAAFFALGLPRIAAAFPTETATEAGRALTVGGIAITPSDGWTAPKDAQKILVLRKAGAQITGIPPVLAAGDAKTILTSVVDPMRQDKETAWQFSEPQAFTTASGASGAYVVAQAPQQFLTNFVVVQDGRSTQVIVSGTDADWTSLHDEILDMIKTVEIPAGAP